TGSNANLIVVGGNLGRLGVSATSAQTYSWGQLTLAGTNTYGGSTIVKTARLGLDFSAASAPQNNIIANTSALVLGNSGAPDTGGPGAAALVMTGKASTTNAQTFNGTTVGIGAHAITVTSGTSGAANLNLGAITY